MKERKMSCTSCSRLLRLITIIISILIVAPLSGQEAHPAAGGEITGDTLSCDELVSRYRAALEASDPGLASEWWRVAAAVCPPTSELIYDDGETIYGMLYNRTGDTDYMDTVITILTRRAYYLNDKPATELRKASLLFDLAGDEPLYLSLCYNILTEVAGSYPDEMDCDNFVLMAVVAASLYAMEVIDAGELEYSLITAINTVRARMESDPSGCSKAEEIDDLLTFYRTCGAMTCAGIDALYGEMIDRHFRDTAMVSMVHEMLLEAGCQESDLFYNIAVKKFAVERSVANALRLAELNAARNNMDKAVSYFTEAYNADKDSVVRSGVLLRIALTDLARGRRQEARNRAEHAWELNPSSGRALMILAECYAGADLGNKFDSLASYWVAADYLEAAVAADPSLQGEAAAKMRVCMDNFPTREDCFFQRILDEGVVYTVGGWVNEVTRVRFRKE